MYTHTDKCIHAHRQNVYTHTDKRRYGSRDTHTQRPTSLFNLIPTSFAEFDLFKIKLNLIPTSFEEFSLLDDSCTNSSTGTSSRPCLSHLSLSRTSTLSQNQTISLCVSDFSLTFTLKIFCLFASSSIRPPQSSNSNSPHFLSENRSLFNTN